MLVRELLNNYNASSNKLILLDYDGTLVDFTSEPAKALPPLSLMEILTRLSENIQTRLVIITGRTNLEIDRFLGHLPITIVAEHGAVIKENNVWKKNALDPSVWKKVARPIMEQVARECTGSILEVKDFSITWHYRQVEKELGYSFSRRLITNLNQLKKPYKLKILDGNKVVEVMGQEIGKGKAAKSIIQQDNYDLILSIGDDKTDEEVFEELLNDIKAITIKVGNNGDTSAKYKLENVGNVISLLDQLSKQQCQLWK